MKTLSGKKRDPRAIAVELREHYPQGLPGGREQLVTGLMNRGGLGHSEAVELSERLFEAGHARHLPGDSGRWFFTSERVSMRELMARVDEHYDGYVSKVHEPRGETLEFIGAQLGVDQKVADEVLNGLEHAGYTSVVHRDELERDRVQVEFPEAFRTMI